MDETDGNWQWELHRLSPSKCGNLSSTLAANVQGHLTNMEADTIALNGARRQQLFPWRSNFSHSDLAQGSAVQSDGSTLPAVSSRTVTHDGDNSNDSVAPGQLPSIKEAISDTLDRHAFPGLQRVGSMLPDEDIDESIVLINSITGIGAGLYEDQQLEPGHVGLSEQSVVTMSSTSSKASDHFPLADIAVRFPGGCYQTFGAKCDTAAQFNIIAEATSRRLISSEELLPSDKDAVRGLSKIACPIKGMFKLTFSINRKNGSRIGPYRSWFYVVEDKYIHNCFDALLSEKFVKKYGLLVEEATQPSLAVDPPIQDQLNKLSDPQPVVKIC